MRKRQLPQTLCLRQFFHIVINQCHEAADLLRFRLVGSDLASIFVEKCYARCVKQVVYRIGAENLHGNW